MAHAFEATEQEQGEPLPSGKVPAPVFRFHDLRHFFASMLIAQGESPKYVCDQMGHSSIQVTFDTYGHLFPQARQEATAKFEQAMFEGRKKPSGRTLVETKPEVASPAELRKDVN